MVKVEGKTTVEKKGMEDEIRSGFDYEMTIAFNITNAKHMVEAGKDRTRLFTDQPEFVITPDTGKLIRQWCEQGVDMEAIKAKEQAERDKAIIAAKKKLEKCKTVVDLGAAYKAMTDELQHALKDFTTELKNGLLQPA